MYIDLDLIKHQGDFTLNAACRVDADRVGIFGPSGSGKSTLGSLIAGFCSAKQGHIRINDTTLFSSTEHINTAPEKRRIGVVFQHAHLFPHLNVRDNLLFGYKRTPQAQRIIPVEQLCKALDIEHLLARRITNLSGGEKQRIALGRALLGCPQLLILDEPLSALDEGLKKQIIPYLRKTLRRYKIPFLYISHSLLEMRLLTDVVIRMQNGKITHTGPAEGIAREQMDWQTEGYKNLLELHSPREVGTMLGYRWGDIELLLTDHPAPGTGIFELSSRDVLLCREHPAAISARNLLHATIVALMPQQGCVGIELKCGGNELFAQVVCEAAAELDLQPGQKI
ncbi:MAG: molybdenum ABC transporter ATP-binding protein [Geobacteraceae bacterium]|nr:molybdenum ABC transporter ATP-binding protein [Geobacteraceae bacterium]